MTEKHLNVLYIEDNHDNRKLVHRVLRAAGINVIGVVDGIEGLAFVEKETPDLILVDMQLPEIDGYTLTARLRKLPQLKDIPIVALTANVLKEDQDRSFAAGCTGFIDKPINVDLLPQQVQSYVSKPLEDN